MQHGRQATGFAYRGQFRQERSLLWIEPGTLGFTVGVSTEVLWLSRLAAPSAAVGNEAYLSWRGRPWLCWDRCRLLAPGQRYPVGKNVQCSLRSVVEVLEPFGVVVPLSEARKMVRACFELNEAPLEPKTLPEKIF
ncbi:MAG: hypothetical protein ABJN98_09250 [Roseibium sp.]